MQLHQQGASSQGIERKLLELSGNAVIPYWQQKSQVWCMSVRKCVFASMILRHNKEVINAFVINTPRVSEMVGIVENKYE